MSPAQSALVEQYRPLAYKLALRQWRHGIGRRLGELADVVQAGMVGLCRAAACFDPERGASFLTYAWRAVTHEIYKECVSDGMIHVPEYAYCGRSPHATPEKQEAAQRAMMALQETELPPLVVVAVEPWEEAARDELRESVQRAFGKLPEAWREIGRLRFLQGLDFRQIAERVGKSKQRVQQIVDRIMVRLHKLLARWRER